MPIPERFTTFLSLYDLCVEGFLDYTEDLIVDDLQKRIKCNVWFRKANRLVMMEMFIDDIIFKSLQYEGTRSFNAFVEKLWNRECATSIQSLVRGMLTRRKVHFALLSNDDDALARVMGW